MAIASSEITRRRFVTFSVLVATLMQTLDTTIANVALPHMQGSMGATQDQIAWVLTSYIIATAIMLPLTGLIVARFGRKRFLGWAVVGFTLSSMLCGAAQDLSQIVAFRIIQGICSACLVPLSQAVLLDIYPREQHASAMAMWGVGVMVGPIVGPSLGGWLTEYYSWRWVFYINLPFGFLAWLGILAFLPETPIDRSRRFDLLGFAFLSVALGAMQAMLDRGQSLDWFASREIVVEAGLTCVGLYLFLVHIFTHQHPFIEPDLFRDRNFSIGVLLMFIVGAILFASTVLMPPFMHDLMHYPVVDIGLLMVPRAAGTMIAMWGAGKLLRFMDARHVVIAGVVLTAIALWEMTGFSLDSTAWDISRIGFVQGIGVGLTYVVLTTVTFSTLESRHRNEGTALFSLMRNIGSSIGISAAVTFLARSTQTNHAAFSAYIAPFRSAFEGGAAQAYRLTSPQGVQLLNAEVTRQAAMLAYLQTFRLMMFLVLVMLPLALLLRSPRIQRAGMPVE